jgi:hypothetical protein
MRAGSWRRDVWDPVAGHGAGPIRAAPQRDRGCSAIGCNCKQRRGGYAEVSVEFYVRGLLKKTGADNRSGLVARFWHQV